MNRILNKSKQTQKNELTDKFWEAFQNTTFDSDEAETGNAIEHTNQVNHEDSESIEIEEEPVSTGQNQESELEREVDEISDDESNEGIHVGFDGESDRSEDEQMTEEDRMFLDDENVKEPTTSGLNHLAMLNLKRYEDDETNLKRLVKASKFIMNEIIDSLMTMIEKQRYLQL